MIIKLRNWWMAKVPLYTDRAHASRALLRNILLGGHLFIFGGIHRIMNGMS